MEHVLIYLPWALGVIAGVLVILFIKWILGLRRIVPTSEVHVVRRGKQTEIYGNVSQLTAGSPTTDCSGNVYYQIPQWVPFWGVNVQKLPLSNFSIKLDKYEAYDKDKLEFVVNITAFFRIADYRQAASRIADNSTLRNQLMEIVQGAVRTILASDTLEKIMVQRSIYGKQFTEEVKENLKEWGVVPVKSIELMDINDKPGEKIIANIMAKKKSFIDMESRTEVAENNRKAREAEIASQQAIELKEEDANETVGKRRADREREVGIADERSKQAIQEQMRATKEKEMEVARVNTVRQAEIDKEKTIIEQDAQREREKIEAATKVAVAEEKKKADTVAAEASVIVAERNREKARHEAEASFVTITKESEASKIAAENEAAAIEAKGRAEAMAKEAAGVAEIQPQIKLAQEIGENEGYQRYLIGIRQVEANEAVGVEQAKNLGHAQIKIVSTPGSGATVQEGIGSVMELFSAKGAQNLSTALETLAGTDLGQTLVEKLLGKKKDENPSDSGTTQNNEDDFEPIREDKD